MRGGVVVTAAHDPEHDAGVSQCGRLNPAQQQQYKRSRVVVRQPSKHAKPQESAWGPRFFFPAAIRATRLCRRSMLAHCPPTRRAPLRGRGEVLLPIILTLEFLSVACTCCMRWAKGQLTRVDRASYQSNIDIQRPLVERHDLVAHSFMLSLHLLHRPTQLAPPLSSVPDKTILLVLCA